MAEASLKLGTDWATKESSLLGYNDENGNYKPIPFDFSRASIGTRVNRDGLIETVQDNIPRIDFSNGEGSLLLEPQRTNLITYSEDYSQSEWTNAPATQLVNVTFNSSSVSPYGSNGVYQVEATSANGQIGAVKIISSGVNYSSSFYIRRISGTGRIYFININNVPTEITNDLTSSWKRFDLSALSTSTNGRCYIKIETSGDIIEVWGAQLEEGSYSTSLIPTSGSAVTRVEDNIDLQNLNAKNIISSSSPYTIFFDLSAETELNIVDGNSIFIDLFTNENLTSAKWSLRKYYQDEDGKIRFYSNLDASTVGYVTSTNKKFALSVNGTAVKIYSDGALQINTTTTSSHNGFGSIQLRGGSSGRTSTNFSNFYLYTSALTDIELEELTS